MAASSSGAPFVAREPELRRIDDLVQRAGVGDPTLLIVGADAGVGKTRLVVRAAEDAAAHGATVVTGHCVDLGAVGIPYLPLIEALGSLRDVSPVVDEVTQRRPALARLLDTASGGPDGTVDGAGVRLQLLDGLVTVLGRAGSPGKPLVVVLEDAHWADTSTLEVLRFVVARLHDQHLLVVVTYRADDLHRNHPLAPTAAELSRHPRVDRIDLAPFTDDELRTFTALVAGRALSTSELDDVRHRSEGNAYFAEELVVSGMARGRIPLSLAGVLRARVARLDPDVQRLVQIASAAGRVVPEGLLRAAAAGPVLQDAATSVDSVLREVVGHQVLHVESGDRIAFRHALLAEAVYDDLLPGDRVAVHRAYLAALVNDPALGFAAVRAFHALRADDLPTTLVASRDAAREAAGVLGPVEEYRHLEQVLALWDDVPDAAHLLGEDRATLALATARAASRAGAMRRAVELTRTVIDDAPGPLERARLEHVLAPYLFADESISEMFDRTGAAIEVLRDDGPSRARARTYAAHAQAAFDLDRIETCRRYAELAVAEARRVEAPDVEVEALTTLALLERGRPAFAFRLLTEAHERARVVGDPEAELRCRFNMVANRLVVGRLDEAASLAEACSDHAHDTGLAWSMYGMMTVLLSETIRYSRGDLAPEDHGPLPGLFGPGLQAVELLGAVARGDEGTVERGRALRPAWDAEAQLATFAGGATADALIWQGDPRAALQVLDEAQERLASARGESYVGRIRLRALALAALADIAERDALAGVERSGLADLGAQGDEDLARCEQSAIDGAATRVVVGTGLVGAGLVGAGLVGGPDEALPLAPEARAWLERARAEHGRLLGVCGLGANDPARWQSAVEAFGFGNRYELARSRWRWAEALVGAGDRDGARRELAIAVEEADAMGARPLAGACRALARRARLDVGGVRAAQVSVLTDRESDVLRLVARGLSNRQIGEILFISAKTVSVHVSNVLAKLGASGRAEAVSIAHRRGLFVDTDVVA